MIASASEASALACIFSMWPGTERIERRGSMGIFSLFFVCDQGGLRHAMMPHHTTGFKANPIGFSFGSQPSRFDPHLCPKGTSRFSPWTKERNLVCRFGCLSQGVKAKWVLARNDANDTPFVKKEIRELSGRVK
jgi:hypothetical protein